MCSLIMSTHRVSIKQLTEYKLQQSQVAVLCECMMCWSVFLKYDLSARNASAQLVNHFN